MTLRLHDTLSGETRPFVPLHDDRVGVYSCGPTVYGPAHIGNFRSFLFADVLVRHLRRRGLPVTWVMNVTDIDDKIIRGAAASGETTDALAERYLAAFLDDAAALRMTIPDVLPRATHHIDEIVALITTLLDRGHAYRTDDGSIFFRISSWPSYGRLARLDPEGQRVGERVEADEYGKDDVRDFALWKGPKPGEPSWDTTIGPGRPGWHIECSAMSMTHLGPSFDIHTGGVDLIFPHHEDEIAQSEAATGVPVRRDVAPLRASPDGRRQDGQAGRQHRPGRRAARRRRVGPGAPRCALISVHYRAPLNHSDESLAASAAALDRLDAAVAALEAYREDGPDDPELGAALDAARDGFDAALDDDLNVSAGLAAVFDLVRDLNRRIERALAVECRCRPGARRAARPRPRARRAARRCRRSRARGRRAARSARGRAGRARLRRLGPAARRAGGAWRHGRGHPGRPALAADGGGRPWLTGRRPKRGKGGRERARAARRQGRRRRQGRPGGHSPWARRPARHPRGPGGPRPGASRAAAGHAASGGYATAAATDRPARDRPVGARRADRQGSRPPSGPFEPGRDRPGPGSVARARPARAADRGARRRPGRPADRHGDRDAPTDARRDRRPTAVDPTRGGPFPSPRQPGRGFGSGPEGARWVRSTAGAGRGGSTHGPPTATVRPSTGPAPGTVAPTVPGSATARHAAVAARAIPRRRMAARAPARSRRPTCSVPRRSWSPAGGRSRRSSPRAAPPIDCSSSRSVVPRSSSSSCTPPGCASRSSRSRAGR